MVGKLACKYRHLYPILVLCTVTACSGDDAETPVPEANNHSSDFPTEPGDYAFQSRFTPGNDSVSYSGQVARQVLMVDLKSFIDGLSKDIDGAAYSVGGDGSVVASLDFYFRFDSDAYGDEAHGLSIEPAPKQSSYGSVSSGKDLVSKLAGNDAATDHKDWSTEFGGWADASLADFGGSVATPEGFVIALFEQIEQNAMSHADGVSRFAPDGVTALPVHVTQDGRDLSQLTAKFLTGAIAFSQGTDDYLDDDVDGKGLLSPNTRDEDADHTVLEHAWDEGFGYFGAARYTLDDTDENIAETGYADFDGDGAIDLLSEFHFGAATNAAKRDLGSATGTDFTTDAFTAFWNGRAVIANAAGELSEAELGELRGHRDTAVLAWEKALAATVVHYINDTVEATGAMQDADYSFANHAKVWSEMKGFALAFQFNPRSPLDDGEFSELHTLLRDAPELSPDGADSYVDDLLAARGILGRAYDFDDADLEAW